MTLCARLIRNGDLVFDVGGHIGYMALYFASLVGALWENLFLRTKNIFESALYSRKRRARHAQKCSSG